MANLQFKSFVWPQNPSTYTQRVLRTPVYQETASGEFNFTGLSGVKRTISGSGVFTGPNAVSYYQQLEQLASLPAPGNLVHPVLGTYNCYLTEVEITQEPQDNVIHYRFVFRGADSNNAIPN